MGAPGEPVHDKKRRSCRDPRLLVARLRPPPHQVDPDRLQLDHTTGRVLCTLWNGHAGPARGEGAPKSLAAERPLETRPATRTHPRNSGDFGKADAAFAEAVEIELGPLVRGEDGDATDTRPAARDGERVDAEAGLSL